MTESDGFDPKPSSQKRTEVNSSRQGLPASPERGARVPEAIATFANGIAHDLNNITAVILGYAEELREDLSPSDPLLQDIDEIIKAGKRAHDLSLQLSLIAQNNPPELSVIDLNMFISPMLSQMQAILGEKITFDFSPALNLKPIMANQQCLSLLLSNIARYARSAMSSRGSLSISTSMIRDASEAEIVLLTISDSCQGINPNKLPRLFEPYYDAHGTGKDTGLYLTLVYSIVQQLSGSITVECIAGQGLVFRVYLPAAVETSIPNPMKPAYLTPHQANGKVIMIVDDEPQICELTQRMVETIGFRCVVFQSAQDALTAIRQGFAPDLVISDLVMPELDGIKLITQIKSILPEIGIILISGYPDKLLDGARALGSKYPMLLKPFTLAQLSTIIMDILHDKKSRSKLSADIFILDDDENIRILLGRACTKRGHILIGAESLEEALEILSHHSFDILIIDQSLQETNGITALREIRKMGLDTPALIFTGAVINDYTEIMTELNVIKVMEKAFDNNPLLDYIEKALGTL